MNPRNLKSETSAAVLRRLAVVLQDAHDAITVQDLKGNILAWNKGAERMYGYTETEALDMNIARLVPPDTMSASLEYLSRIAPGAVLESFEAQRISKGGTTRDVWIVLTYLRDDSGSINSIATTERDITEIKNELKRKDAEVRMLKGLLPICASCKQIRDDKGYWHQIETYFREHSEVEFSHGICPDCARKLYPDLDLSRGQG